MQSLHLLPPQPPQKCTYSILEAFVLALKDLEDPHLPVLAHMSGLGPACSSGAIIYAFLGGDEDNK